MHRDPETENELNYIAWKNEHAQRRRDLRTQFQIWRNNQCIRMDAHQQYRRNSEGQTAVLEEMLKERIENACSCATCRTGARSGTEEASHAPVKPAMNQLPRTPS